MEPKNEKKQIKKKIVKENKEIKEKDIQFNSVEGKFLHIKVGDEKKPADKDLIEDIERKVVNLLETNKVNCLVFVTHHAVEINII
jgi:hypothetical protein